jgi:hypothetical protein
MEQGDLALGWLIVARWQAWRFMAAAHFTMS